MLTRKGCFEQAEHVTSPQEMEYDVTVKTRTNLCRNIGVHTKPLNGVRIHKKNVTCGSFYNMDYFHSFQLFGSRHFHFSFGTRTAHQEKIKSINHECMQTSNLSD